MLAQATREALDKRGWSLRAAQTYTGVNATTVDRMKQGHSVKTEDIVLFARGVAEKGEEIETIKRFLGFANKNTIVALLEAVANAARSVPDEDQQEIVVSSGRRVRILAFGDQPGTAFEATPANLELIQTTLRAVEKAKQEG